MAPFNALALLVGSQTPHGGVLTQCAVEEGLNLRLGLKGLTAADSVVPGWLSTKFLLFAAIIGDGIVLRWISGQWYPAIARLQAGDTATGEEMLRVRRQKAIVAALAMWLLIATAGFIGTLKP